jgi:hypothetical protein
MDIISQLTSIHICLACLAASQLKKNQQKMIYLMLVEEVKNMWDETVWTLVVLALPHDYSFDCFMDVYHYTSN